MRFKFLLGIFIVLVSSFARSQTEPASVAAQFSVSPALCRVNQLGEPCLTQARFSWSSVYQPKRLICIFQHNIKLVCSQQARGELSLMIKLINTTQFHLVVDDTYVASQLVEVVSQAPKTYRRRLHSDWSLF